MKKLLLGVAASVCSLGAYSQDYKNIECVGPESEMGYSDSISGLVDVRGYDEGNVEEITVTFGESAYFPTMIVSGINMFESTDGLISVEFSDDLTTASLKEGRKVTKFKCQFVK